MLLDWIWESTSPTLSDSRKGKTNVYYGLAFENSPIAPTYPQSRVNWYNAEVNAKDIRTRRSTMDDSSWKAGYRSTIPLRFWFCHLEQLLTALVLRKKEDCQAIPADRLYVLILNVALAMCFCTHMSSREATWCLWITVCEGLGVDTLKRPSTFCSGTFCLERLNLW